MDSPGEVLYVAQMLAAPGSSGGTWETVYEVLPTPAAAVQPVHCFEHCQCLHRPSLPGLQSTLRNSSAGAAVDRHHPTCSAHRHGWGCQSCRCLTVPRGAGPQVCVHSKGPAARQAAPAARARAQRSWHRPPWQGAAREHGCHNARHAWRSTSHAAAARGGSPGLGRACIRRRRRGAQLPPGAAARWAAAVASHPPRSPANAEILHFASGLGPRRPLTPLQRAAQTSLLQEQQTLWMLACTRRCPLTTWAWAAQPT